MKITLTTVLPAVMLAAAMTVMTIQVADAQPYTYQGERAQHPNLARAVDAMAAAYRDLQAAPADFGGHKAEAMRDIARAIHSTKHALYFRMRMDDAAIDRAP